MSVVFRSDSILKNVLSTSTARSSYDFTTVDSFHARIVGIRSYDPVIPFVSSFSSTGSTFTNRHSVVYKYAPFDASVFDVWSSCLADV